MEKRSPFRITFLALTAWLSSVPCSFAGTGKPLQSWLTAAVSQRFDYGLEFLMENEQRFSTGNRFYQRYELTPQMLWHYSPRYDFGLGYEENREWDENGNDIGGHEGLAFVTVRFPVKDWLLTVRQRLQGGSADDHHDTLTFRQQTRLSYEGARFPFRLRPYLQDEWFLDLADGEDITENRAQVGLSYTINRSWRADIYGMALNEWEAGTGSSVTPVLGLNINLTF